MPFFITLQGDGRPGGPENSLGIRQNVACIVNTLFGSRYKRRIQEKREGVTGRGGKGGERLPWYLFRMWCMHVINKPILSWYQCFHLLVDVGY